MYISFCHQSLKDSRKIHFLTEFSAFHPVRLLISSVQHNTASRHMPKSQKQCVDCKPDVETE